MENLEKVEVDKLIPTMPSFNYIQEWIGEHLFEIALVFCFLALVIYKYGQKEISMAKGYRSIMDQFNDGLNNLLGRFWLATNMDGNAIRSKVTFNEDENEEYEDDNDDDDNDEENKAMMYI